MDIKSIFIFSILCYVGFKTLTKELDLLDAFVLLLPFKTISFEFGLTVYAFQIPILMLAFVQGSSQKNLATFFNRNIFLLLFLAYVTISTTIISNFFIDKFIKNDYSEGFLRGEGRYIAILIRFLFFDLGIIYLIYASVKDTFKVHRLIKMYLYSLVALSFLGILQVSLSLFMDDIFPNIIDSNGNVVNDKSTIVGSLPFVRLTSLGGEPKNLGCSLSVGVALLLYLNRYKIMLFKNQKYVIWLFVICIILSLSTSAFGLLIILSIIAVLTGINKQSFWRFERRNLLRIPILIGIIVIFWNFLSNLIEARIFDRSSELASEEIDQLIIEFLVNNPQWTIFGSGSGNIHNLVDPTVYGNSFANYLEGNIFVSRYGYVKLISENGIIGFALFIMSFGSILYNLKSKKYRDNTTQMLFYSILTVVIFFFARSNYVISELMLVTGLAFSYLSNVKKNTITN